MKKKDKKEVKKEGRMYQAYVNGKKVVVRAANREAALKEIKKHTLNLKNKPCPKESEESEPLE